MTGQEAAMAALGAGGVGFTVAVAGFLAAIAWGKVSARGSRSGSPGVGNHALGSAVVGMFGIVASATAGLVVGVVVFLATLGGTHWLGGSRERCRPGQMASSHHRRTKAFPPRGVAALDLTRKRARLSSSASSRHRSWCRLARCSGQKKPPTAAMSPRRTIGPMETRPRGASGQSAM